MTAGNIKKSLWPKKKSSAPNRKRTASLWLCCAAGGGRGSDPDELHPSPEHRSRPAHHRSLPQHVGLGGGTRTAAHVQSRELPGVDGREDPSRRPAGTAGCQGRLLGRYHQFPHQAQVLFETWWWRQSPKTLDRPDCFEASAVFCPPCVSTRTPAVSANTWLNGIQLHFLFGLGLM